jgi:hypothetical protein
MAGVSRLQPGMAIPSERRLSPAISGLIGVGGKKLRQAGQCLTPYEAWGSVRPFLASGDQQRMVKFGDGRPQ